MAGNQTGIIGLSDDDAGQKGNSPPGARSARPGPIGLLAADAGDELQSQQGPPGTTSQIAVKVTSDGTTPIAGLQCTVTVGSSTPKTITTDNHGFLFSSDQSAGAVTVEASGKLVKLSSNATPNATLAVTPKPPVRGSAATITITAPTGAIGFKVIEWSYNISHTNPGSSSASTGTVKRPASENPSTFDQQWQGTMCASGKAVAKFIVGETVRASGNGAVNVTVTALDPVEASLDITVSNRSGFGAGLKENQEQTIAKAIGGKAENLGEHKWSFGAAGWTFKASQPTALGPNNGCVFVTNFTGTFSSTPGINAALTNATSPFSLAQDKAYLIEINRNTLNPAKVIPRNLYSVGQGGAITITNKSAFDAAMNLQPGDTFKNTGHCITQPALLAGTRRHEAGDPDRSHKANCLKALRALDPGLFAEALVRLPGATLDFQQTIDTRVKIVNDTAASTHSVVDEAQSKSSQILVFVAGKSIPDVNMDANDQLIGPAWDPTVNAELT
jgi:hypothetical protein